MSISTNQGFRISPAASKRISSEHLRQPPAQLQAPQSPSKTASSSQPSPMDAKLSNGNGHAPAPAYEKGTPATPRTVLGVPRSHRGSSEANPYGMAKGLHKYHYSFWDPEIAHLRKVYLKMVVSAVLMIIALIWVALPVYWGAFRIELTHAPDLVAWIIDRDGGVIGQGISQSLVNASEGYMDPMGGVGHLGWRVVDPAQVGDDNAVADAIVNEAAWAAVVIESGASSRLMAARANGDPSYNPTTAITWYVSEARNEDATDFVVIPLVNYILQVATSTINVKLAASYLPQIAGNATALQALARAPQTIAGPVAFTERNLRPFTAPDAIAVELVGCIYIIIIAFIYSNVHAVARQLISPHLTTRSYLLMRLFSPLALYLPLSLAYAMISLPFKLPFDGKFSYAGGWFLFWAFCYLAICSLGLAIEAMITILTPRFAFFFLIPWIIANVSVASLPFELMQGFYRYGYAMPVYNLGQAARVILFNTRDRLGLNAGILIAWTVLSLITTPVFTLIMRSFEMKAAQREVAAGNKPEAGFEGGGSMIE